MSPSPDPADQLEKYNATRVLWLSVPAAIVFSVITAGMALLFGVDIPGLPSSVYFIADKIMVPALSVIAPLSIFTSWRVRKYLRRFPTRDFAMDALLAFNFLACIASLLLSLLLLLNLWSLLRKS